MPGESEPFKHQPAPLDELAGMKIRFHGVNLMSNQLNITPGVALVRVNSIDAGIRWNMTRAFGEREGYAAQGTKSVLLLEEQGQEPGVNIVCELTFPSACLGATRNVGKMVLDSTSAVTSPLVLRTSLSKAMPAFRSQAAIRLLVEILRIGGVYLATVTTRAMAVAGLESHSATSLLDGVKTRRCNLGILLCSKGDANPRRFRPRAGHPCRLD